MWAVHSAVHPSSALYVRWVGVNEYWPNQGRVLSESQCRWLRESLGTLYIRGYGHGFGQKIIQGYPGHNWGQSISDIVAGLNPPAKTLEVKNVYCYDGHMAFTIILLELYESIEFDRFVQPICLPIPNANDIHGNIVWVSGWSYYSNGDWRRKLQQAKVISNVSDVVPEEILYVKRKANNEQVSLT
ncbi:hypothetical protein Ddc_21312 [Ditylenchus destructor]|nr:hypothetical protein Ddc_21312 [Ditylenchus destructor]